MTETFLYFVMMGVLQCLKKYKFNIVSGIEKINNLVFFLRNPYILGNLNI